MAFIRAKLFEQRGEIAPAGAAILIIGVILLTVALQVNYVYATVDQIKEKTNTAVLSVAASNVGAVHDGVREGESAARHFTGTVWSRIVSTDAVVESMTVALNATASGAKLTRTNGVQLDSIHVAVSNNDGGKLNFTTTMTVKIPLSVGGGILPPIQQRVEVHTTYEPKF